MMRNTSNTTLLQTRQWERERCVTRHITHQVATVVKHTTAHINISHKIFSHLAEPLLGLILAYQEYYHNLPLMPCKHGTKACEHIFGWLIVMMPGLTVLNAQQMIPKIFTLVKIIISGDPEFPKSEHIHWGFFFYFFGMKVFWLIILFVLFSTQTTNLHLQTKYY